jgi:hypothetical protein
LLLGSQDELMREFRTVLRECETLPELLVAEVEVLYF